MMACMSFADALDILYEDNHCLALNKPAGWPTTHFDGKDETVDRLAKSYLKEKYQKPGNVFLGVVHRLDGVPVQLNDVEHGTHVVLGERF